MELSWLKNIIDLLPDNSDDQKSFFDISGFPKWETVNSNLLAFYFDKEEEHNLKALFIESLLMLLKKDANINFDDNFEIFREYRTIKGNLIDVVIKSNPEVSLVSELSEETEPEQEKTDWAIIIENKIDAPLYNDLTDYWNSVDAAQKIGVVLSKNEEDVKLYNANGIYYHNITHKALVEQVLRNLHKYFSKANERHLILLKEYIKNIEKIYYETIMDEKYSIILNQFYEHNHAIKTLHKTEMKLLKFVSQEVFDIFKEFNFVPNNDSKIAKTKHFYADKKIFKTEYDGLRFWVDLKHIMFNKEFRAFFELYDIENTKYGTKVKDLLSIKNSFTKYVSKGVKGGDGNAYNQIYSILIPLTITDNTDFPTELKTQLETHFFKHPNDFLNEALNALSQAKIS